MTSRAGLLIGLALMVMGTEQIRIVPVPGSSSGSGAAGSVAGLSFRHAYNDNSAAGILSGTVVFNELGSDLTVPMPDQAAFAAAGFTCTVQGRQRTEAFASTIINMSNYTITLTGGVPMWPPTAVVAGSTTILKNRYRTLIFRCLDSALHVFNASQGLLWDADTIKAPLTMAYLPGTGMTAAQALGGLVIFGELGAASTLQLPGKPQLSAAGWDCDAPTIYGTAFQTTLVNQSNYDITINIAAGTAVPPTSGASRVLASGHLRTIVHACLSGSVFIYDVNEGGLWRAPAP